MPDKEGAGAPRPGALSQRLRTFKSVTQMLFAVSLVLSVTHVLTRTVLTPPLLLLVNQWFVAVSLVLSVMHVSAPLGIMAHRLLTIHRPPHAIQRFIVAKVVLSLMHMLALLVSMRRWPPPPRCQTSEQH